MDIYFWGFQTTHYMSIEKFFVQFLQLFHKFKIIWKQTIQEEKTDDVVKCCNNPENMASDKLSFKDET